MGLFDNALKTFDFSAVTFDSWYAATKFLEHIHSKGKFFFSELKSNRNISIYHPGKKKHCFVKPDELATLIKKHFWHKVKYVKYRSPDGSEVSHKTYSFDAKLKDSEVPIKFVVGLREME